MPSPQEVTPWNFPSHKVIYSNNGFSVAWGKWEDNTMVLGMRWDGNDSDPGYPKTFGHPVWFILPEELNLSFLQSLLLNPESDKHEILRILLSIIPNKNNDGEL